MGLTMRVCFVVTEYFGWGAIGGFGHLSRKLTKHLAERGIDTHVIMQKSIYEPQPDYAFVDGVHIHAFTRKMLISHFGLSPNPRQLAQRLDADIYHAQAMNIWAYHVQRAVPDAQHLLTCQDPTIGWIWQRYYKSPISRMEILKRRQHRILASRVLKMSVYRWMEYQSLHQADLVACQAKYLIALVKEHFHLSYSPMHLPNPIDVNPHHIKKSSQPSVLFMGRFDPVKRPWIFLKIAKLMPHVQFYMAGKAHNPRQERQIKQVATKLPNLTCLGYVLDEEKERLLDQAWIYLNCSIKECLPVAFLEACAHKCAIVSHMNPDDFASNFGFQVPLNAHDDPDSYAAAIRLLLSNEAALHKKQNAGYDYVTKTHETHKVINQHLTVYRRMLN